MHLVALRKCGRKRASQQIADPEIAQHRCHGPSSDRTRPSKSPPPTATYATRRCDGHDVPIAGHFAPCPNSTNRASGCIRELVRGLVGSLPLPRHLLLVQRSLDPYLCRTEDTGGAPRTCSMTSWIPRGHARCDFWQSEVSDRRAAAPPSAWSGLGLCDSGDEMPGLPFSGAVLHTHLVAPRMSVWMRVPMPSSHHRPPPRPGLARPKHGSRGAR